jgi:uncharacterized low-complexity protein
MKKQFRTSPVSLAIGVTFAASIAASSVVQADVNPFAVTALSSGYMVASSKGSEAQCGANKSMKEAKCGAEKAAQKVAMEEEIGASKSVKEGECGAKKVTQPKPIKEAKCGEAKCGANK